MPDSLFNSVAFRNYSSANIGKYEKIWQIPKNSNCNSFALKSDIDMQKVSTSRFFDTENSFMALSS
jgi:hypothetical protein